jgi:acyl carrier protein
MEKQEFLKRFIEELNPEFKDITLETSLDSIEEWDSLGVMVITSWLNDEFKFNLEPKEIKTYSTILEIFNLIKLK